MIARTLCFGSPGKLALANCQLVWTSEQGEERTFPIEDLGFVIVETDRVTLTAAVLRYLAESNVALVICGETHLPAAQMVAYDAHTISAEVTELQLEATDAVRNRLWRQVCRQKILNQAQLMKRLKAPDWTRVQDLAEMVKNGDPTNCEGQAARIYFHALGPDGFVRAREGDWPNAALNYGYAILRAAVARAIVGSGLVCFRGIHHHNRYNAFALADDLMEPYRPYIDQYIFGKVRPFDIPMHELSREMRARLLEALTCDVNLGGCRRPLQIALSITTASFVHYLRKETDRLTLPEF